MLKKLLYNKYKIVNIDKTRLPYTSEEIFKVMYDKHNVICFEYGEELRILGYTGYEPDFLGRATRYQPIWVAGSEVYLPKGKDEVVLYTENALGSIGFGWSTGSYVEDDITNYIEMLKAIDNSIIVNTKQVLLPFVVKTASTRQAEVMKSFLKKLLGDGFDNMVVECKLADNQAGTLIETTNIQLFIETLQNTKKKILEEVFLYLGIGAPAGKLAHESIEEVVQNEQIVDLLDTVMYDKFVDFITRINERFNTNMSVIKKF